MSQKQKDQGPARWIDRFLEWYCADNLVEEIQGDLHEAYYHRSQRQGSKKANFRFFLDVVTFFRPSSFKKVEKPTDPSPMYRNYIKAAFRNFSRNKVYGSINLLGLVIGVASCLFIALHVLEELSYDSFHPRVKNKYRVVMDMINNGQLSTKSAVVFPAVGLGLEAEIPEVTDMCRILPFGGGVYSVTQADGTLIRFNEDRGVYADENFFRMFGFQLLEGNIDEVLTKSNQTVLSESTAARYFGEENPIGKSLRYRGEDYIVAGIMADFPENSHMQFDIVSSLRTWSSFDEWNGNWGWYDFYTFIEVAEGADMTAFTEKVNGYLKTKKGEAFEADNSLEVLHLQPLADIHLKSKGYSWDMGDNGGEQGVYFLSIIAVLVLIIAWVNFINLSTARAVKRAHEVGIRKVIGAKRRQLVSQFLFESAILNLLAILLAVLIVVALTPVLDSALAITLERSLLSTPLLLRGLALLWIFGSLISGLYPAMVLSSFHPLRVLKGNFYRRRNKLGFRQILVTIQFSISIILILGTMVVVRQLQFMQSRDLGVEIDQTLVIKGPTASRGEGDLSQRKSVFRDQLEQLSSVNGITLSNTVPGEENFSISDFTTQQAPDVSHQCYIVSADEPYFENFGIKVIVGRDFREGFRSDSNSVVINRTAAKMFGFELEDAIGQRLNPNSRWERKVVGVVEDYHHSSLKEALDPILFIYHTGNDNYFSVKLATNDIFQSVSDIESVWDQVYPDNPFDFFFLDEFFDRQYKSDAQFNKVFSGFAILAIIVACMGLFGLVSFTIEQSRKEIGIRKVLGAPVARLITLFIKDYAWMIVVSMVIAFPVAHYLMTRWLQDFAYQISLSPLYFVISALFIILIAITTVGFKSFQAAHSNPVDSLREE